jgi:hypothetical protein
MNRSRAKQPLTPVARKKWSSAKSFTSDKVIAGKAPSTGKLASARTSPKPARHVHENPRLAALKQSHFTKKGQKARISRGLKALERFRWDLELNPETIRWAAEDPEIEHL